MRIEKLLEAYRQVATYTHNDRFWESDSGNSAVRGWGTRIEPHKAGAPIDVWFDAIDHDIVVSAGRRGLRRPVYVEWLNLTDFDEVLKGVTDLLGSLLRRYP